MNFFQSAILVALITNFVFGIVVISIKFHRRQNQGFFLLTMVLGAWLLALFMAAFASSNEHLMFWIKQSSASSALIPVALNLLRLSLVERDQGWVRLMIRARWWLAAYPVILFICQTPWFLRSAELPIPGQAVATPDYGPGFIVFTGYLAVTVVMLLVHYVRDIRQSSGIQKVELQFVLIGLIFGFLVGVLLVIIPNVTGVVELGQLLPLPVFAADSILAYGIATRNIMDVSAFLRRVISNLLLVVYLVTIYLIIYILSKTLLPVWLLDRVPAAHVLAALGMAFLLSPSYFQLNQVLGRVFVGISNQDVADVIKRSSKEMVTATTSRELVRAVSGMLESLLHPTSVYILYREDHRLTQILPSNQTEGSILSLRLEEPLANALEQEQKILNRDLFARFEKSDSLNQIERSMDDLGVVVAAGIYSKNRMEGAILLGPRTTGQIYGSIEVQAIESVCEQLAVSLENAKLYTEVQNSRIYNDILLDRLVSGVVAVNTSGQVTVFNREAQRITALPRDDVLHADFRILPPVIRDALEDTLAEGGGRDMEAVLSANGHDIPIRYGCVPFHSHTGKKLGALLVFTDQTEVKKLEQQIRRTDRLASLGTLAAGMAHEIKNPLVAMKTFTQLLPERYEDPDFRGTFSTLLGEEVSRIDRIVNQLLRFARPAKPSLSPIGLHEVIEHTLSLLKQQLRQRNVTLEKDLRAERDAIEGDADMLTQALLNFLLNAVDALEDAGGRLIVRTEIVEEPTRQFDLWGKPITVPRLRLSIVDNGKGIDPKDIGHVFDPFYTTKASGTGLGLSVSHGIIVEHQGMIDVESQIGAGTTFFITFPLLREAVQA